MPNRDKRRTVLPLLGIPLFFLVEGCAATAPLTDGGDGTEPRDEERCDRADNDGDALVDEDFRNDAGDYIDDEHCGWCNNPCVADDVTKTASCEMTPDGPTCIATECTDGYIESGGASCVPWDGWLCLPCLVDQDCGPFEGARCESIEGEFRCTTACIDSICPEGYACKNDICLPESKSCICGADDYFEISCTIEVNGGQCMGTSVCENGILSPCRGTKEVCDRVDNDCNGLTDEPFVDSEGRYTLDLHHCGACGVDCTLNQATELEIDCGGSWVVPRCTLLCTDAEDGLQIGDFTDADLDPNNGCECQVQSIDDIPGVDDPSRSDVLDANCDGADGVAKSSIYVIPTGNDNSLGTPTEPLATITRAIDMALASLNTDYPRPHIFVAAGVYTDVLRIINGIHIHGGYRPDFLQRSDTGFGTEIHASSWSGSPGGAALVAEPGSANAPTFIDGLTFRGASAQEPEAPAFGAYLNNPGPGLRLIGVTIISGDGSDGTNGEMGMMGERPLEPGYPGDKPKLALEDPDYECLETDDEVNRNNGGMPGLMRCGDVETNGGAGGSSYCAYNYNTAQASGEDGKSVDGADSAKGGSGGWNAVGPLTDVDGNVFCGLADFLVSSNHEMAADGEFGEDGRPGSGGSGCQNALGFLDGPVWQGAAASPGKSGLPGGGGGGGGAGGSVRVNGYLCDYPYPDGLGGGGGGGGAGGCGGEGGTPGTSGGPSVGMMLYVSTSEIAPHISDVNIITGHGGHGGRGGHGGDGGFGSAGGVGGELLPEERSIPPLSGADSGGNGGGGGNGGRGGGGGGGCGGSVIGIWLVSQSGSLSDLRDTLAVQNSFTMGTQGSGGEEGVGGISGTPGVNGEVHHVFNR